VPARAAVAWTATFENGDLSEWMPGINPTKGDRKNVEVLGEKVYTGMYAGKISVHPDDTFGQYNQNRVDIQHQSSLTDEGEEMWLSGHYLMAEDAKVRNQIGFFESNTSFQNVMDFWVEPKQGGGTTINFGVGFLGDMKLWTGDFTTNAWHQIAIHVLWSTDAAKGTVDVWFDGMQVVMGHKRKTKADNNTLFYQTGLHRRDPAQVTDTIYFDDFIEADTMLEAKIAAPMMPGAGGAGGAGGGGMAGSGGAAAGSGGSGVIPMGGAPSGVSGAGGAPAASGMGPAAGMPGTSGGSGTTSSGADSTDSGSCSIQGMRNASAASALLLAALLGLLASRRRRARAPHA
jgi:MYXO-CTERM domain-containing protein